MSNSEDDYIRRITQILDITGENARFVSIPNPTSFGELPLDGVTATPALFFKLATVTRRAELETSPVPVCEPAAQQLPQNTVPASLEVEKLKRPILPGTTRELSRHVRRMKRTAKKAEL